MRSGICHADASPFIKQARKEAMDIDAPQAVWDAFTAHYDNTKRRKLDFLFTFREWWSWWQVDDRWSRRGVGRDKLVMSRFNDSGPYSPDNVYCSTHHDNCREISANAMRRRHEGPESPSQKSTYQSDKRRRHVITPFGIFANAGDAAEAHGISEGSVIIRAQSRILGFRFGKSVKDTIGKSVKDPKGCRLSRAVITPMGRFESAARAAEAYGLTRQMAAKRARDNMSGFRYECHEESRP